MIVTVSTFFFLLVLLVSASSRRDEDTSWIDALTREGYTVREGMYGLFDVDTCFSADTCYAINPITPYGLMYLPPHPNESDASGSYQNTCYKHNLCKRATDGTPLFPAWRLAPGETIVVLGRTPPKSTYWSISPSLYTRRHPEGWKSNATGGKRIMACPPGPSRCELFSSVNDPINMQSGTFL